ncbi:ABC transporter ATP-binding protein [Rhizobium sp. LEGMi135b]
MPSVSFEHIVKKFGEVKVLSGLNLAIDHSDFLVLLGPSGCGKTTLLNLLAGLADVSSGRIMIGERDVTELDPKDRGLAMVFQSYALYPTKTVEGNLRFGLSALKLPREEADRRIKWAASLLQLEALMNRKPAQLSGGQRQRVAIGRALVKHADVLLFDEPLSNLDAKLRTEMRLEIKKLHEELKPTVVYVTHDQIEAMTMATKIAVMNGGAIQQFGTPDEVYEQPANLFVAGFIGSPGMNLVEARVVQDVERLSAIAADGRRFDLSGYDCCAQHPSHDQPIIIGMRPEHFVIGASSSSAACSLELPVRIVERTGSDAILSLSFGSSLIAVRIEPDRAARLKAGELVTVTYPRTKLNLFDAQSGRRL